MSDLFDFLLQDEPAHNRDAATGLKRRKGGGDRERDLPSTAETGQPDTVDVVGYLRELLGKPATVDPRAQEGDRFVPTAEQAATRHAFEARQLAPTARERATERRMMEMAEADQAAHRVEAASRRPARSAADLEDDLQQLESGGVYQDLRALAGEGLDDDLVHHIRRQAAIAREVQGAASPRGYGDARRRDIEASQAVADVSALDDPNPGSMRSLQRDFKAREGTVIDPRTALQSPEDGYRNHFENFLRELSPGSEGERNYDRLTRDAQQSGHSMTAPAWKVPRDPDDLSVDATVDERQRERLRGRRPTVGL